MTARADEIRAIRKHLASQEIVLDIGDNYFYISSSITNQLFRYVHLFR